MTSIEESAASIFAMIHGAGRESAKEATERCLWSPQATRNEELRLEITLSSLFLAVTCEFLIETKGARGSNKLRNALVREFRTRLNFDPRELLDQYSSQHKAHPEWSLSYAGRNCVHILERGDELVANCISRVSNEHSRQLIDSVDAFLTHASLNGGE